MRCARAARWSGSGAGLDRVALYFREDAAALGQVAAAPPPEGDAARRDPRRARARCALLVRPARARQGSPTTKRCRRSGISSGRARSTNDAWTPLRAGGATASRRPSGGRGGSRGARASVATATQGRWSLTERLFAGPPDRRALAELLLERQGIVTRDGVRAEGIPGGYGAVYAELRALETLGLCRRGYFVEGLGGAQFALGGAVERLRELRDRDEERRRSCWPPPIRRSRTARRCPGRSARVGAPRASPVRHVVLIGGEAVLYVERGGRSLVPLRDPDETWLRPALSALVAHVRQGGVKRLAVERFDGEPVTESDAMPLLVEAGFLAGPRRAVLRP